MKKLLIFMFLHAFVLSAQNFQYNFKILTLNSTFEIEEATEKLSGHFTSNPLYNLETKQFEFQTTEDLSYEIIYTKFEQIGFIISDFEKRVLSIHSSNTSHEK